MARRAETLRTCVVNREDLPVSALVRVVAGPDGEAGVDWRAKLPGRGAWIRCDRASFEAAMGKPAALRRALEAPELLVTGLLADAQAAAFRAVLDMLSLTARAGGLASGADVIENLGEGRAIAMIMARDAAPRAVEAAGRVHRCDSFAVDIDKDGLGHRIGKGPRAVVAVLATGPGRNLLAELRRMQALR